MKPDASVKSPYQKKVAGSAAAQGVANSGRTPRSVRENVFLTVKILIGFALLGAGLWGVDAWVAAR